MDDIVNRFKGYVNEGSSQPKEEKEPELSVKKYMDKYNNRQDFKDNKIIIVNKNKHNFFKLMTFIGIIGAFVFLGYFLFLAKNGAFQTINNETFISNVTTGATTVNAPVTVSPQPIYTNVTVINNNNIICGNDTNSS